MHGLRSLRTCSATKKTWCLISHCVTNHWNMCSADGPWPRKENRNPENLDTWRHGHRAAAVALERWKRNCPCTNRNKLRNELLESEMVYILLLHTISNKQCIKTCKVTTRATFKTTYVRKKNVPGKSKKIVQAACVWLQEWVEGWQERWKEVLSEPDSQEDSDEARVSWGCRCLVVLQSMFLGGCLMVLLCFSLFFYIVALRMF